MLHTVYNLINEDDLQHLRQICKEFDSKQVNNIYTTNTLSTSANFYNRLSLEEIELQDYQKTLIDFLKQNLSAYNFNTMELSEPDTWINKIVPETNKKDGFHVDESYLTAVTYLNEDFTGGNFEYKEGGVKIIRIKPKIGMTLIMDKTLAHRVTPVKTGTRFSLVTFLQCTPKRSKTLL
jgi:hypothetical protein